MSDVAWFVTIAVLLAVVVVWINWQPPRPPPGGPRAGGAGPAPPRTLIASILALACLSGCATPLRSAQIIVGTAADLYNLAQPRLEAQEKRALDACNVDPVAPADSPACVARVTAAWAPVKAALYALDAALDVARLTLLVAATRDAAHLPVDVADLDRVAGSVLAAAIEVHRAAAPKTVAPLLPARALPMAAPLSR